MKKILLFLVLAFSVSMVRADTLAGIPGTNNMSATASHLVITDGLLEWRIAPSNLVAVQSTVILPRTNLAGVRIGTGGPYSFAPQTNALAGAGTTNLVIDGGQAALVRCVPGANLGLLVTNLVDGQEITVEIKQDATGIRTLAIPNYGNLKFGTDITGITLSTNAGYIDFIKLKVRNTNAFVVSFIRGYTE